jgi:hydrogenase-4 component B
MAVTAIACAVLAVAPFVVAPVLQHVLERLPASRGADIGGLGAVLHLPGIDGSMAPGLIAAALAAAVLIAVGLARWGSRRRPDAVRLPLWACGADDLTSRMQYTATSFAQPLQRVFDDVLRPDTDIEVTHVEESHYLTEKVAYRVRMADAIEDRLYAPVLRVVAGCAQLVRRAHTGSVHLYLGYGALGVLIVLVVAR